MLDFTAVSQGRLLQDFRQLPQRQWSSGGGSFLALKGVKCSQRRPRILHGRWSIQDKLREQLRWTKAKVPPQDVQWVLLFGHQLEFGLGLVSRSVDTTAA